MDRDVASGKMMETYTMVFIKMVNSTDGALFSTVKVVKPIPACSRIISLMMLTITSFTKS